MKPTSSPATIVKTETGYIIGRTEFTDHHITLLREAAQEYIDGSSNYLCNVDDQDAVRYLHSKRLIKKEPFTVPTFYGPDPVPSKKGYEVLKALSALGHIKPIEGLDDEWMSGC